jgi:hypothetical protein
MRTLSIIFNLSVVALGLLCCSRPKEPKAEPAASVAPDKWRESQGRSSMDDTVTYSVNLDAEGTGSVRPKLSITCSSGKLHMYVDTRTVLQQDPAFEISSCSAVRYRFDQGEAKQGLCWSFSNDHQAVFVPEGSVVPSNNQHQYVAEFVDQLAEARVFRFEYNPLYGESAVAEFDVHGLPDHIKRLKAQCPW